MRRHVGRALQRHVAGWGGEAGAAMALLEPLRNAEAEGLQAAPPLGRMHRLLARLRHPAALYRRRKRRVKEKVVHVAGSKGKGSTACFLASIFRAAGLRTGLYTSPHVRSLHERICGPSGLPVTATDLDELVLRHRSDLAAALQEEGGQLTHFEMLTALAFLYFAAEHVDVAVVETGLGGTHDATNVVPHASLAAACISSLSWEHADVLGGTLETIARAKAGILKAGRPLVLAEQAEASAEAVVREEAARLKAPLLHAAPPLVEWANYHAVQEGGGRGYGCCDFEVDAAAIEGIVGTTGGVRGRKKPLVWQDVRLGLVGAHQVRNAASALLTSVMLQLQGWPISQQAIRQGLEEARLHGRFQMLTEEEAGKLPVGTASVVLDGAHNAASGQALASTLKEIFPKHAVALVVAMAKDKDHEGFAAALLRGAQPGLVVVSQVAIAGRATRSMPAEALADVFRREREEGGRAAAAPSLQEGRAGVEEAPSLLAAVATAGRWCTESGQGPTVVVVTGSLHAVAAVLDLLAEAEGEGEGG